MSWLQNTFRGLLLKNAAFNLTIQGLIFDRTIGNEKKLPEECLIFSAVKNMP